MKNFNAQFKLIANLTLAFLLWGGCYNTQNDIVPKVVGKPSGGVRSLEVVSVEGNKATFKVRLFALNQLGAFIRNLDKDNFSFVNPSFQYTVTAVTEGQEDEKGPYSALMLFDQSGSITSSDPNDARVDAGRAFASLLKGQDEASVAVFSGSDPSYLDPYTILTPFTTKQSKITAPIDQMADAEGGGTPLYYSMYDMLFHIDTAANNDNKALIAFTDGEDTQGGKTPNQIIQKAQELNIQVYTVGLQNFSADALTQIALSTKGAVMLANDAPQLISLYSSLGDMLRGRGQFLEVTFEITNGSGNFNSTWNETVELVYQPSENITIQFPIYLFIP